MCSENKTELTDELRTVHAACSLTLAVLGTFGNAVSMILICKGRLYQAEPIIMLIIGLCVANALSTGVALPIISATSFYRKWIFGHSFCKAFGYLIYVALTAESLTLTNLTVCQYLMIVHRVSIKGIILNRHKHLRLFALVGLPWVITTLAFLVPLTDTWDTFGYEHKIGFCTLIKTDNGIGYKAVISIALICIMTVVTFYCYSAILYIHIKSRSKAHRGQQLRPSRFQGCTKKVLLMISAILANYLLTYLPFLVSNITDPCRKRMSLPVYTAVIYIAWSHSAINPIIYALMNSRVKVLLCNTFRSFQSTRVYKFSSGNISEPPRRITS